MCQLEPWGDGVGSKWVVIACARRETERDFISVSDARALLPLPFLLRTREQSAS